MATLGLVGGLGPESTIDYYRRILDRWARYDPATAPSIVIDSLDAKRALQLAAGDHAAFTDYLASSVARLARAGADVAAMTANTAHLVFDDVAARSPIPLMSIVECCADEARRCGVRRPLLLGTRFTMEAAFYPVVFARRGIEIATPPAEDRARVHARYVEQLLAGDFRAETRAELVSLIERLRGASGIDAVILGGTELPLLLDEPVIAGVPVLDTTALHVAAIVDRLRALAAPPRPGACPD